MSELMNVTPGNFRRQLLTGVSALALLASIYETHEARAEDSNHPVFWIEVGGGLDQMSQGSARWLPPNIPPPLSKPESEPFGKLPSLGFDTNLKLSFMPENSSWVYSASILYGRAEHGPKKGHDQAYTVVTRHTHYGMPVNRLTNYDFIDVAQRGRSAHAILDFSAGKDLGIGMLHGSSTVSFGVRIAQLNENAQGYLLAFTNAPGRYSPSEIAHKATFLANRNFNGLGPSVAWDAQAPLAGSLANGFSLDWGANAAILFGRQKADVSLRTRNLQYSAHRVATGGGGYGYVYTAGGHNRVLNTETLTHSTQGKPRARTVIVPNIGGFAGVSWRLPDVKVSLGYRADFFFGAIDGGLTTSQKETRGFYGPFANVSIGLGG